MTDEHIDTQIDAAYDRLDALLWFGNFTTVDGILRLAACNPPDASIGIAMLTITRTAAERLPSRALLRQAIKRQLEDLGEDPEISLHGL